MSTKLARTVALLSLTGCGSLVDTDYRGEVLFELSGTVIYMGEQTFDNIGVALAWSNQETATDAILPVVVKTTFPAQYTLQIFSPPPENATLNLFGNNGSLAAIGKIYLFEDTNDNGVWDLPMERLVGSTFDSAVVWVDDGVAAGSDAMTPFFDLEPGFHFVNIPYVSCSQEFAPEVLPMDAHRADLYIGYTDSFDYNCDGDQDIPVADDPFFECPPPELIQEDCAQFQAFLDEDVGLLTEQLDRLDPDYRMCLEDFCGELMDSAAAAAGQPAPSN